MGALKGAKAAPAKVTKAQIDAEVERREKLLRECKLFFIFLLRLIFRLFFSDKNTSSTVNVIERVIDCPLDCVIDWLIDWLGRIVSF